jgi:hypothetical protein
MLNNTPKMVVINRTSAAFSPCGDSSMISGTMAVKKTTVINQKQLVITRMR